jgi:hypothetical protein
MSRNIIRKNETSKKYSRQKFSTMYFINDGKVIVETVDVRDSMDQQEHI